MARPLLLTCLASILLLALAGCAGHRGAVEEGLASQSPAGDMPPPAEREFRAAWVATVGNIDWPSEKGLTADQQKQEVIAILDKSVDLKLNAIILQVRTSADALYESDIEPWSEYLTGVQGRDPGYDPLHFWIEEAHKRGIELHAWFNPFRAMAGGGDVNTRAANHVWNTKRHIAKEYGGMLWMDPGEKEAEEITVAVFLDVVRRYDIDGIHIDDYFYPYPVADSNRNEVPFPDDPSWQRYQVGGGTLSRDDWRRENINRMIRRIYEGIKVEKRHVKFGISPFSIWKPGYPRSVAGFSQYDKLYADAKLWLNEGWIDYYTPQLYFRIGTPQQDYIHLLQWWIGENTHERHMWPGLFTSRVSTNENGWNAFEIVNEVWINKTTPGVSGSVHFSMRALMQDRLGIAEALVEGPYRNGALIPASPWLDDAPPPAPRSVQADPVDHTGTPQTRPRVLMGRYPAGSQPAVYPAAPPPADQPTRLKLWTGQRVSWQPAEGEDVWLWAVYARHGTTWKLYTVPGGQTEIVIYDDPGLDNISAIYVAAVDRSGNEGRRIAAE